MDTADTISARLAELGDPVRAEHEKRYLKSGLRHLGVPVPAIRKITVSAVRGLPREETLAVAGALWREPVHELRTAAVEALARDVTLLMPADLALVERLIRESGTWALVDPLAIKVAGALIARYTALAVTLDRWVADADFWIRRSALLALLPGIRSGTGDLARLSAYGDALIDEKEFFIRKALGWVMRELSKTNPEWVAAWVRQRVGRISGVTIREAVRHLPEPDRVALLATYQGTRRAGMRGRSPATHLRDISAEGPRTLLSKN